MMKAISDFNESRSIFCLHSSVVWSEFNSISTELLSIGRKITGELYHSSSDIDKFMAHRDFETGISYPEKTLK